MQKYRDSPPSRRRGGTKGTFKRGQSQACLDYAERSAFNVVK